MKINTNFFLKILISSLFLSICLIVFSKIYSQKIYTYNILEIEKAIFNSLLESKEIEANWSYIKILNQLNKDVEILNDSPFNYKKILSDELKKKFEDIGNITVKGYYRFTFNSQNDIDSLNLEFSKIINNLKKNYIQEFIYLLKLKKQKNELLSNFLDEFPDYILNPNFDFNILNSYTRNKNDIPSFDYLINFLNNYIDSSNQVFNKEINKVKNYNEMSVFYIFFGMFILLVVSLSLIFFKKVFKD
jgi:hypothetical protein